MWKPNCDIFLDYILELGGKSKAMEWSIHQKSSALGYNPTFSKDVKPGFYNPTSFNMWDETSDQLKEACQIRGKCK